MSESSSISTTNHSDSERACPVLLPYHPGQRQYGPFRGGSEGGDARFVEIDHPLQVVAGGHHRHRKVRSRLTNCANQLPAHLRNGSKRMLDPGTGFGNPLVTPLLAFRQRLVPLALRWI